MKTKMTKQITIILLMLFFTGSMFAQNQNVGINNNGSSPDGSAMLDVSSTTKGFLAPRMTKAQRDAITSPVPATGLLIYQTDNTPGYYYYNGTAWAALTGSSSSGFTHYIGELFGGGIVVAVWKEAGVEKGLIASLVDMQTSGAGYTMAWSGNTSVLIGATAHSPIDGQTNTNAIIGQSGGGNTADKAATVCDAYTNTETGTGTYSDWYLPAAWELNQCYNAAFVVNTIVGAANGLKFATYWNSTEDCSTTAWGQGFSLGYSYGALKEYNTFRVRAVRRF